MGGGEPAGDGLADVACGSGDDGEDGVMRQSCSAASSVSEDLAVVLVAVGDELLLDARGASRGACGGRR